MVSRFFISPEQIRDNTFTLAGSEARHAVRVLRKKVGDIIDLFDGKDLSLQGRIDTLTADRLEGTIVARQKGTRSSAVELILCTALIKGPRWDWLVEKACEIGVARLVPLTTARTVVKPAREAAVGRWKRIAMAASKQCGRPDVMEISEPKPFPVAISDIPHGGLALIPWEKEQARTIRAALSSSPVIADGGSVALFIGPEGGWDSQEVDVAVRHGVIPVRLGPTLLRSETAGLAASILVFAEFGEYA